MMASFLTSAACAPTATVTASASVPTACSRYPDSLVLVMISSLPLAPVCSDDILFYATHGSRRRERRSLRATSKQSFRPATPAQVGRGRRPTSSLTIQRLADGDELARPLLAELGDLLRRVAENAAAGL